MQYECAICGLFVSRRFELYFKHIGSHRSDPQFNLFCLIEGCRKQFKTYFTFKSHIYRVHHEKLKTSPQPTSKSVHALIKCSLCLDISVCFKEYLLHLVNHIKNGSTIICPFTNCGISYKVASSLTSHIARYHKESMSSASLTDLKSNLDPQYAILLSEEISESEENLDNIQIVQDDNFVDINDDLFDSEETFLRTLSFSILKLQEQYYLPVSTVDSIVSELTTINEQTVDLIQNKIRSVLIENNVDPLILENVTTCLTDNVFVKSISNLKSNYLRNKHWKSQLRYIEPQQIKLDVDECHNEQNYQYIPILESLRSLLSNEEIMTEVMNPLSRPDSNILKDFSHGKYFKENELFNSKTNALQLILYFDEFEVVNPLGSKRGIHKICAFYYSLAKIYPHHRSELKAIQLCLLCPSKVLKSVGFHKVLEPLMFDLNVLETEGIQVLNISENFFGTIAFISGDNLGSHQIGGFSESFGPNVKCICRFCMASPVEIQSTFKPGEFDLRNKLNYEMQVKKVSEAPSGAVNLYGVKSNSVLNNLKYFHVTRGLPPDCMHDIFEGCAKYEIPLILQKLESEKLFTKNEVIKLMKNWKYGSNDVTNKPPVPKNFNSIPASASQMWTLLRILPLIIGRYIPENNKTYGILLTLKEIAEIVCSPKLNVNVLSHLSILISEHLELFSNEFPENRLIPKQHFLIHYPEHILNFGPLRSCWCMRFEGKHNYFKVLSQRLGNFKNICLTLATRHQRLQAYLTVSDVRYFKDNQILSSSSIINVQTLDPIIQKELVDKSIFDTDISHTNKIMIRGIVYQGGMYVVTRLQALGDIELSKILGIYIQSTVLNPSDLNAENVMLLTEAHETIYNPHLGSFEVKNLNRMSLYYVTELVDYYPLDGYVVDGIKNVTLKHSVP